MSGINCVTGRENLAILELRAVVAIIVRRIRFTAKGGPGQQQWEDSIKGRLRPSLHIWKCDDDFRRSPIVAWHVNEVACPCKITCEASNGLLVYIIILQCWKKKRFITAAMQQDTVFLRIFPEHLDVWPVSESGDCAMCGSIVPGCMRAMVLRGLSWSAGL